MALQTPLGIAVVLLIAGQRPDDEAAVTAAREKHVGAGMRQCCLSPMTKLAHSVFHATPLTFQATSQGW